MFKHLPLALLFSISAVLMSLPQPKAAAENVEPTRLFINEIRFGGTELELTDTTKIREYITLFNPTNKVIPLEKVRLEYAKSSFDKQYCSAMNWRDHATSTVVSVLQLSGSLEPSSLSRPITRQLNDSGSGSLRLMDISDVSQPVTLDVVGWGSDAPCTEKDPATALAVNSTTNKSISRFLGCEDDLPIDNDDNLADFNVATSNPETLSGIYKENCEAEVGEPIEETIVLPPCDGLVVSEVLPNPAGIDKDNEFIELYNPGPEAIWLEDCNLKTSANSDAYVFPTGSQLLAGEYKAFFDSETALTLANAAGGEVLLIGTAADYNVQYPADMLSDHSWALIDGNWYDTATPTPSAPNTRPEANESTDDEEADLEPCPAGKYRSPETNRCRNVQAVTTAHTACRDGQIRNPETNRCRNITSLANSLLPCREGQVRNPETNRCRRTDATSETNACQEGYERNPETNRCRKIPAVLAASSSVGTPQGGQAKQLNSIFLGLMSLIVLGYGGYEYRRDIGNMLAKLNAKKATKLVLK